MMLLAMVMAMALRRMPVKEPTTVAPTPKITSPWLAALAGERGR